MKLSTRIITAVLLLAGSSGVVYAFSKHGGWHLSPDEKIEFIGDRVTQKLDLDAQQRQYFDELATTVAGMMLAARDTRQQHVAEISALITQPSFDQVRALELVQQKTSVINDKAPVVIASLGLFLDSLNPEQKLQLREFVQQHHGHRRHRGNDHGHHGLLDGS